MVDHVSLLGATMNNKRANSQEIDHKLALDKIALKDFDAAMFLYLQTTEWSRVTVSLWQSMGVEDGLWSRIERTLMLEKTSDNTMDSQGNKHMYQHSILTCGWNYHTLTT